MSRLAAAATTITTLVAVAVTASGTGTAQAAGWHGWLQLDGDLASRPAVASWAPGRLDVFAVGPGRSLWHKWYSGRWSGWENLGGVLWTSPAAVSWGPGRIDVVALDGGLNLVHKWYSGGRWSGWESLGYKFPASRALAPAISSRAPGHLDVFAIDDVLGTPRMIQKSYTPSGWTSWRDVPTGNLPDDCQTTPSSVSWSSSRVDIFMACRSGGGVGHVAWDGTRWGSERLGAEGVLDAGLGVAVTSWAPGRLDVFGIGVGSRNQLYHKWYQGGWSAGWEPHLGLNGISGPGAVSWGPGRVDVFVNGPGDDNALWQRFYG